MSPIPSIAAGLGLLYADHALAETEGFADFHLDIAPPRGLRRWVRPQVICTYDGYRPFEPLPIAHAFPLFEWAQNWCISTQAHQYLIIHAAVVERGGRAIIMPGTPGAGKSTLCAALISRGWRLLSDELTMIGTEDCRIVPLARPISLKNESIEVIRKFVPGVVVNKATDDTVKGSVTHMKVPSGHVRRTGETASAGWIVFPKYVTGAKAALTPRPKAGTLLEVGRNAFNYGVLGRTGFDVLGEVVEASDCYDFRYGDLGEAVALFDRLQPPDGP